LIRFVTAAPAFGGRTMPANARLSWHAPTVTKNVLRIA